MKPLLAVLATFTVSAYGAPSLTQLMTGAGNLDPTFGIGGLARNYLSANNAESAYRSVLADDGIFIVGYKTAAPTRELLVVASSSLGTYEYHRSPAVANASGGLTPLVQADGKKLALGWRFNGGYNDFMVSRFSTDGEVDTSFGQLIDGQYGNAVTAVGSYSSLARGGALQSDGKIVAVGESDVNFAGTLKNVALVRYRSDGTLDTSFDGDGKVTHTIGNSSFLWSAAMQTDGKIVAVGQRESGGTWSALTMRYRTDGSLDTSFASVGYHVQSLGTSHSQHLDVKVQSDGKVVSVGYCYNMVWRICLMRYNTDGTLDTSFDGDGLASTTVGSYHAYGFGATLQPDGKLLVAGGASLDSGDTMRDLALVRFRTDGTLDTSFDGDGKVTTSVVANSMGWFFGASVQSDGKIVAAGSSNGDFAFVRYETNGALDTTFNGLGKTNFPVDVDKVTDEVKAMAVDSNGNILVAGSTGTTLGIARYTSTGVQAGMLTVQPWGALDQVRAMAIPSDGKWLFAGRSTYSPDLGTWGLFRMTTAGVLDTSFNSTGKVQVYQGASNAEIESLAVQSDGKIVVAGTDPASGIDVARFHTDGTLDTSFVNGAAGGGSYPSNARGIAIQSDGKIVVGGDNTVNLFLRRYHSDGTIDTGFGTTPNGVISEIPPQPSFQNFDLRALRLQSDGKIVVGARANIYSYLNFFAVYRYNTDGSLDTSFDGTGYRFVKIDGAWAGSGTPHVPGFESGAGDLSSLEIDELGRITLVGSAQPMGVSETPAGRKGVALFRCHTCGATDNTFGTDGSSLLTPILGSVTVNASAIDALGRIVLGGIGDNDFLTGRIARSSVTRSLEEEREESERICREYRRQKGF